MKFLVVLALTAMAMAEPEADPQLLYNYQGYQGYQAYPYNYNYGIPATSYYNVPRVYHSYGKREADAEPEADPSLIYTNTLPFTPAVHSPIIYKTLPLAEKTEQTEKVSTPLVYTHAMPFHQPLVYKTLPEAEKIEKTEKVFTPEVYTHALPLHQPFVYNSAVQTPLVYNTPRLVNTVYNTALNAPLLPKVFPSLKTFTTSPVVSHIAKRDAEAEADPALVYTTGVHQPIVYNSAVQTPLVYNTPVQTPLVYNTPVQTPLVYNSAVQTPLVYKTPVQTPLLKTVDNAVVPAVGGYIHSSHVGVCTNNLGIRVPC